jgi:hypothetical protein
MVTERRAGPRGGPAGDLRQSAQASSTAGKRVRSGHDSGNALDLPAHAGTSGAGRRGRFQALLQKHGRTI